MCSEQNLVGGLLFLAEDEGLASLDHTVASVLALSALKLQHDLLGVLGLLLEDGLGLTSETLLLHVVSPLSGGHDVILTLLVLRHLVDSVFLQLGAESSDLLWNMHHLQ